MSTKKLISIIGVTAAAVVGVVFTHAPATEARPPLCDGTLGACDWVVFRHPVSEGPDVYTFTLDCGNPQTTVITEANAVRYCSTDV